MNNLVNIKRATTKQKLIDSIEKFDLDKGSVSLLYIVDVSNDDSSEAVYISTADRRTIYEVITLERLYRLISDEFYILCEDELG